MTEFIWQLPTAGDGRYAAAVQTRRGERDASGAAPFSAAISDPRGARFNYFDYLHQVARAVELAGFDGVQVRHDLDGDESWIVAGYIARSTRRLKLLTEFDAARGSAVYAAKNAVSYQRFSGGRFAWQLSSPADAQQRRRQGDFIDDADVPARTDEFLQVAHGVMTQAPFSFKGRFFEVLNGGFQGPLGNKPLPQIYLDGDSDAGYQLSTQRADVHVFSALAAVDLQPRIAQLQALAAGHGRTLSAGLRIDVLARETEQEAQRDAERFLQQSGRSSAATGIYWPDFATARTGAAAALVGSYEQVAQQLVDYADAGVTSFLLAAIPHLEEAYRVGEYLLPPVRERIAAQTSHAA